MKARKGKRTGRPPTGQPWKCVSTFRMTPEMKEEIEGWADWQFDKPSFSEAMRRLIYLGLTVLHV